MDSCLLIDNSNTRTKFALAGVEGISSIQILPTAELSVQSIRRLLNGCAFNRVCLCSVVPTAAAVIQDALSGYPLVNINSELLDIIDFSEYPGLSTLGADRVVNVWSALHHASLPLVAVDMGTATTFDVLIRGGDKPIYAGGAIAPGFKSYSECLSQNTAMLPPAVYQQVEGVIGKNTQEAIFAGVFKGYAGMVDAMLSGIEKELGEPVHVVITGGDADTLAPMLQHSVFTVPGLTMQGIAMAAGIAI